MVHPAPAPTPADAPMGPLRRATHTTRSMMLMLGLLAACMLSTASAQGFNATVYEPTDFVEFLAGFWRYDAKAEFDPHGHTDTSYQLNVAILVGMPLVLGVILMIVVLLTNFIMCCKCGRKCCTKSCCCSADCCCGNRSKKSATYKIIRLFFVAVLCACGAYLPRESFNNSAMKAADTMNEVGDMFGDIDQAMVTFETAFPGPTGLHALVTAAGCPNLVSPGDINDQLQDMVDQLEAGGDLINDAKEGFSDNLDTASEVLEEDAPTYVDYGLGGVVGLILLLSVLAVIATCTSCKADDAIVLLIGVISLFVVIATVTALMGVSVVLGDFCYYGPANSTLALLPGGTDQSMVDMAKYYTTCKGTDPFLAGLSGADTAVTTLTTNKANGLFSGCTDQSKIDDIITMLSAVIVPSLDVVIDNAQCKQINEFYVQIVHENLCDDFVQGITELWIVLAAAGFVLLIAFIVFPFVTFMGADVVKIEYEDEMVPAQPTFGDAPPPPKGYKHFVVSKEGPVHDSQLKRQLDEDLKDCCY